MGFRVLGFLGNLEGFLGFNWFLLRGSRISQTTDFGKGWGREAGGDPQMLRCETLHHSASVGFRPLGFRVKAWEASHVPRFEVPRR